MDLQNDEQARDLPQLHLAAHMSSCVELKFAGGRVVFFAQTSPDKSTPNEDAVAIIPVSGSAGVLAIADGCGGQANGQLASKLAVEALVEAIAGMPDPNTLRAPILDGFELAMQRVGQLGTGAATTLVVVEINEGFVRTYHAGDSQILVVGNRGKIKLQTRSHSPVGYAVESGMLTESAALDHEDRHLVSNVIGTDDAHIDIGSRRKLDRRDTVLLGSDGLFDNLRQNEIVELIRKGSLLAAGEATRALAAQRMLGNASDDAASQPCKPDDLSIILFRQF